MADLAIPSDEQLRAIRRRRRLVAILVLVIAPASLVYAALVLNPHRLSTLKNFSIENRSEAPLRIALVGTWNGQKGVTFGHIDAQSELAARVWPFDKMHAFTIEPRSKRPLSYEADDLNFCWIIVKLPDGSLHALRTDVPQSACELDGSKVDCCKVPHETSYVIEHPEQLPAAPESLAPVIAD